MHTPAQTDAPPPMLNLAGTNALLRLLEAAILNDVRNDGPDLTTRALAILLVIHTVDGLHTIRGIAAHLGISRPAASRSMDRLEEFALAKREDDPRDARSVLLVRTSAGAEYVEAYARTAMASGCG